MVRIDSLLPLKVLLFKRRRRAAFLDLYKELSFESEANSLFIDSTREIGIFLLVPTIIWRVIFQHVIVLSTSYPATIASSVSIRRSVAISNFVENYFPKSVVIFSGKKYEFYPRIIAYYLIVIRKNNFNPWYEGTSELVTMYCTKFPVSKIHLLQLSSKCKLISTYKNHLTETSDNVQKSGVLFALPQFYEQGYVSLEASLEMIKLMLLRIRQDNPNSNIECSLHPRMNKFNYESIPYVKHQNNLEDILPKFEFYYTINSSTIFSAIKHCEVRVFKLPFLDYSFIEDLVDLKNIQFLKFDHVI